MRIFYVAIANIALPFLIFYLRNYIYKFYYVKIKKDLEKEPPSLDLKMAARLFFIGVCLLTVVLGYFRLMAQTEQRVPTYEVKEYNFR